MLIRLQTACGERAAPYGLLNAAEVQQLQDMQDLVAEAYVEAQALLVNAQVDADRLLDEARQQASRLSGEAQSEFQRGWQAGFEEGERQAAQAWHDRHAQLAMDQSRSVQRMHGRLADVVTAAVGRIVQAGDRAALYQRALRSVQDLSRGAQSLTLRVGNADHEAAQRGVDGLQELRDAGLSVSVVVDAALPPGSCIFESDLGVVDASLQTQLRSLREAMSRAVLRALADTPPPDQPARGRPVDDGDQAMP